MAPPVRQNSNRSKGIKNKGENSVAASHTNMHRGNVHREVPNVLRGKRPSDAPIEIQPRKRAALGNITNREVIKIPADSKKGETKKQQKKTVVTVLTRKSQELKKPLSQKSDSDAEIHISSQSSNSQPSSQGSNFEDSLCERLSQTSTRCSKTEAEIKRLNEHNTKLSQEAQREENTITHQEVTQETPEGIEDIDKENQNDIYHVPDYAFHIFEYYKEREKSFLLTRYMEKQRNITSHMRAILVDWLVEVQENFELNHETLYLAVKLIDHYLQKNVIGKESLQLLGSTALFIACKFDERIPPLIDDFLYICDDAYTRKDLIRMEISILQDINFDLGIPISYRFLRRYAKCAKASMETLTLARYILELSLQEYQFVDCSDSQLASAALLLALKMSKSSSGWDKQLEHYSGYESSDLISLAIKLNDMVASSGKRNLHTIRNKYSHKVFFEVAKTPTIDANELS